MNAEIYDQIIVICIKNTSIEEYSPPQKLHLTIGKAYKIYKIDISDIYYAIFDDNGEFGYYLKEYFVSIEEYRNIKLKKLDI